MGIPQDRVVDVTQFQQDKQAYNCWFQKEFSVDGDEGQRKKIYNMLYAAIRLELTEKQRTYFTEYYFDGLTIEKIARRYDVGISTVSRGIKRAMERIGRVLKYSDPSLMRIFEENNDGTKKTKKYNRLA